MPRELHCPYRIAICLQHSVLEPHVTFLNEGDLRKSLLEMCYMKRDLLSFSYFKISCALHSIFKVSVKNKNIGWLLTGWILETVKVISFGKCTTYLL